VTAIPRPFLKWAGGKSQLLGGLRARVPKSYERYFEPFLGGGALFFSLRPAKGVLGDVNGEIVDCYTAVRDDVGGLVAALQNHRYDAGHYYAVRDADPAKLSLVERAARTIFLNKTGFNGLYRVNRAGKFNVPFGRYAKPSICNEENLRACSAALANVELVAGDFERVASRARAGDFVYFDPPYVPLSRTAAFTAYALAGLAPWVSFSEGVSRAVGAITGNGNLVKQIVFPTEVLPLKVVLATIPALLVGLIVAGVLAIAAGATSVFGTLVLLPIAVVLLLLMCAGLAYILAAVGVFLRDIKDIVGVLVMIGFFIHPIIYAPTQVPRWLGRVFAISPFTHVIGCFRDALVDGAVTRPWSWLISLVTALVLTVIGWRVFRMLRPSFGNAL